MDDLTSDTLGRRVAADADAERVAEIRRRASLNVALLGRDVPDRRDLLAALGLPTTHTASEDSRV